MQEHLIPQDISNYKFHLIGELDLKQFGEVMAGVIIAVIINALHWPGIIAWPLMIISVSIGLLAAFVPLGGQPLSHWIVIFVKALFSPTKFYWRKQTVIPSYFTYELPAKNREFLDENSTFNDTPARKHKALAYFSTLGAVNSETEDPLERFTDARVAQATQDFTYTPAPVVDNLVAPKKMIAKPQVGNEQSVRQRQIVTPKQEALESFLETSSIFQPTQIMEEITAADARLANADSTLAAALDENVPPTTPPMPADVIPSPITPVAPSTPAVNITSGITLPDLTTTSPIPTDTLPAITPANLEPIATAPAAVPAGLTPTTTPVNANFTLDSSIVLPDISQPTGPVFFQPTPSPAESTTLTSSPTTLELPGTPILSNPPKPPLKVT